MSIKSFTSTQSGFALAYVLTVMATVLVLLTSILGFIVSQLKYSMYQHDRERTLQIAEAGVHFYKWYLAHQLDGRTASQAEAFWSAGTALGQSSPYVGTYDNGEYSITVTPPSTGSTIVTITSVGHTNDQPSLERTVKVRLRKPSWSENTVVSNEFVRFGEGTEVYGRIHGNSGIRFDGVAHNLVSSAIDKYNDPDHTGGDEFGVHTHKNVPPSSGVNNSYRSDEAPPAAVPVRTDVFEAGRQFPVTPLDFNGLSGDLSFMKSEAINGRGRYFDNSNQGWHIILKSNGTYDACRVQSFVASTNEINQYRRNSGSGTCSSCSGQCVTNYSIVDNGVIFVENNVWLEGTVNNKKLTVVAANLTSASKKSVYISHDIRRAHSDCSETIGVVGQQDVEITRDSNDILTLDTALIAQLGRVGRSNYTGPNAIRDTITVNGAIVSNQRYGFAYADISGNHTSGYRNRYLNYDNNLLYCPPPYFPTGTGYLIDLWEEL